MSAVQLIWLETWQIDYVGKQQEKSIKTTQIEKMKVCFNSWDSMVKQSTHPRLGVIQHYYFEFGEISNIKTGER